MEHPTLLSKPLSLSFIFIIIIVIVIIISAPTSHGTDDENYTTCHEKTYYCGEKIKEIGYPFWGEDRPPFCGVQGFNLTCKGNENTTIVVIEKQEFRVLHINQSAYSMTIARADLWDTICPAEFINTILNFTLFDYDPHHAVNISLFYDCLPEIASHDHIHDKSHFECPRCKYLFSHFECPELAASQSNSNYPYVVYIPEWVCKSKIKVPVLPEALGAFWGNNPMSVEELVKQGFGADYHKIDEYQHCKACKDSGGECGTDTTTNQAICFCHDGHQPQKCQGGKKQLTLKVATVIPTVGVVIPTVGAAILCAFLIFWFRKKTSTYKSIFFWRKSMMKDDNVEAFLKINGSLVPQRYSYSRIKKVTNSFQYKLGKGGYGDVYKGKLLDGRLVVVKLLNETKGSNGQKFINEVASISRTSHVNIKFIHNNKSQETKDDLEWKTMHKIALGVARGLEYLHRGCTTRIFHFDIKPHNILLDEDFCLKISDFGLAKLCPKRESIVSMLHDRGTIGYMAPEVFSRNFGRVSHKADVYSYGMLVLEMVRGRENIRQSVEDTSDLYFPHLIHKKLECDGDIGLHGIESEEDEKLARQMILVGLCCIQANPSDRPTTNKVIEMLEGNLESLPVPPEPFLSLPSRTPIASSIIQIS
ncbi:unnamed protein product [Camellia sinensis]